MYPEVEELYHFTMNTFNYVMSANPEFTNKNVVCNFDPFTNKVSIMGQYRLDHTISVYLHSIVDFVRFKQNKNPECTHYDAMRTAILSTLVHELYHANQNYDHNLYSNDELSIETVEAPVHAKTYYWIMGNKDTIEKVLGFNIVEDVLVIHRHYKDPELLKEYVHNNSLYTFAMHLSYKFNIRADMCDIMTMGITQCNRLFIDLGSLNRNMIYDLNYQNFDYILTDIEARYHNFLGLLQGSEYLINGSTMIILPRIAFRKPIQPLALASEY